MYMVTYLRTPKSRNMLFTIVIIDQFEPIYIKGTCLINISGIILAVSKILPLDLNFTVD